MDLEPIDGELLDPDGTPAGVPPRKELILRGRANLAELAYNPDSVIPPDVVELMDDSENKNTKESYEYWWGFWIVACGRMNREHCPATKETAITVLWRMWTMTNAQGKLRGRYGQPYSPRTVEHLMYVVSAIHQRKGYASPTWDPRPPTVTKELEKYTRRYAEHRFREDKAVALSYEDNLAMARACDLGTVQGLRMATATRLKWDMGARIGEILSLDVGDLSWPREGLLRVWIAKSKQSARGREVLVEAVPDVDGDVDPERLVGLLVASLRGAGLGDGPLFRDVHAGHARLDGKLGGTWRTGRWTFTGYELTLMRLLDKIPAVKFDPVTGEERHITSHSDRAGHITTAANEGIPREKVAARTGHSLQSNVIHGYYRAGQQVGENNAGSEIRRHRRPAEDGQ